MAKCRQTGSPREPKNRQNSPKSLPRGLPKATSEKHLQKVPILRPSGLQKSLIFIVGVIKNKKSRVPEKAPKITSKSLSFWRPLGSKIIQNCLQKGFQKSKQNGYSLTNPCLDYKYFSFNFFLFSVTTTIICSNFVPIYTNLKNESSIGIKKVDFWFIIQD